MSELGHCARILALGLWAVNACVPPPIQGPTTDTRDWTQDRGSPSRAPSAAESLAADPVRSWTLSTGRSPVGSPAIGDSVIAVQGTRGSLDVIWREDGSKAWSSNIGNSGATGPIIVDSLIVTASGGDDGEVVAYSVHTGRPIWKHAVRHVVGPIVSDGVLIFAATERGGVVALERDEGAMTWSQHFSRAVTAGPSLQDDRGLLVTTRDSIFMLSTADGEIAARNRLPAAVTSVPASDGQQFVFSSPDGVIFSLDGSTLDSLWGIVVDEPIFGGPALARDTVFAASIGGVLWRVPLSAPEGSIRTELDIPVRASPGPISGGVIVAAVTGEVVRVAGRDGEQIWSVRVDGPIEATPIVYDGVLLVVDGRGKVHTWR